jgi:hypothetical protein
MNTAVKSDPRPQFVHAEAELERAKAHFNDTLGMIERRLSPEGVADDVGRALQSKMSDLGKKGVEVVRDRPIATAAGASALIAVLAGRPLWKAAKRLFGGAEHATA